MLHVLVTHKQCLSAVAGSAARCLHCFSRQASHTSSHLGARKRCNGAAASLLIHMSDTHGIISMPGCTTCSGCHPIPCYAGQYGMVLLSQFPIDAAAARTFQHLLYKDMPGALMPTDPHTGQPWYSTDDLKVRLFCLPPVDTTLLIGADQRSNPTVDPS